MNASVKINPLNPSTDNISIENIPIHTMKDDLKNINNPDFLSEKMDEPINSNKLASPFLSTEKNSLTTSPSKISIETTKETPPPPSFSEKISPEPEKPIVFFDEKTKPLEIQEEQIEKITEEPESNLSFKKIFVVSGVVFLFIAMAVGGYYYWISKRKKEVPIGSVEPIIEPTTPAIEQPVEPVPVAPVFSVDKPNYLVLDIKTADAAKIKTELTDRSNKIISAGINTPVEFIISDANFTPLSFKYFTGMLGIKLSEKIISNAEEKFSLFIYNDSGKAKLGLILDMKDEKTAKTQITQAESMLVEQLNPLLMDATYTLKSKTFNSSQYENLNIRYNNLLPDSSLSIDYAFSGKKLIIGTSKMTLRYIYDYIKNTPSNTTSQTAPVTPNNSEIANITTTKTE